MFLMSEFFRYSELEGSAYMNYLNDVREEYSVLNDVYVKQGADYVLRTEVEENETLKEQAYVEYYMKKQKKME